MRQTYHLSEMLGIGRLVTLFMLLLAIAASGCRNSGKETTRRTTPAPTGSSEEAEPRPARPTRSEIACHLHSCAPPRYCNRATGVCELLPCTDSRDCPYGYKCDFSKNVCR